MIATPDNVLFYDTECTGLWPWATLHRRKLRIAPDRPFMFQVSNLDGQATSFRGKVNPLTREVTYDNCKSEMKWLKSKVENSKVTVVGHNMGFELRMTTQPDFAWKWQCRIDDTQVMWRLVRCDELTYALKPLCKKYFDFDDADEKALHKALTSARRRAKQRGWMIATEESHGKKQCQRADYWLPELKSLVKAYGESDTVRCHLIWRAAWDFLQENKRNGGKVLEVYQWEQRMLRTITGMEHYGVTYLRENGVALLKEYRAYRELQRKAIARMGYPNLNINSPVQMKRLFIEELKYEHLWKTDAGNPKIDSEQLMVWARGSNYNADIDGDADDGCELARAILEYKAATKVIEYLESYEHFCCHDRLDGSFVLHPSWNQSAALTGRFSCSDPNMQQVASQETARRRATVRPKQRQAFGPRPGYMWYLPDYSQVEIWIFAFLSGDNGMKKALLNGTDLHLYTARTAWGQFRDFCTCGRWRKVIAPQLEQNPDLVITWDIEKQRHTKKCMIRFWRMRAKEIFFSRTYGGGNKMTGKIAFLMRKGLEAGKKFIQKFDKRLPGIRKFIDRTIEEIETTGFTKNAFGREYHLDKQFAYKGVNYDVQGTAADVLKRAMVRVDELLRAKYPKSHLVATIHDELVIEVHLDDHGAPLMREILTTMQADSHIIPGLTVPLPVAMKITNTNWAEARDVVFLKRAA